MANSPDESYRSPYQRYLQNEESFDELQRISSDRSQIIQSSQGEDTDENRSSSTDCRICRILEKPEDLYLTLNQGLFYKFTSSQDYYYCRDINAILLNKRRPFVVRYYDDLIYDECKERLREFYPKQESKGLLKEIQSFYVQFRNFPKNFHLRFSKIMDNNIRRHRRLEYNRVFHHMDLQDDEEDGAEAENPKDRSKEAPENHRFNFMEMLSNSFLQENYHDVSNVVVGNFKLDRRRDTEKLLKEMDHNFRMLHNVHKTKKEDHLSNAMYNNDFMLYSRSDSETAEDMLRQIVNGFKKSDFEHKPSTTLADKILQGHAGGGKSDKQRTVTQQKQRPSQQNNNNVNNNNSGNGLSINIQLKNSLITLNNLNNIFNFQLQKKGPQTQSTTVTRGSSNPRTNSRNETTNSKGGKMNDNKSVEHKSSHKMKQTPPPTVESLHDFAINREGIITKLDSRSNRSKSGALKTILTLQKSSSATKPISLIKFDSQTGEPYEGRKIIPSELYLNIKSRSPSPGGAGDSTEETGKPPTPTEYLIPRLKNAKEAPDSWDINARIVDTEKFKLNARPSHKKSQSSVKRTPSALKLNSGNSPSMNIISALNSSNSNTTTHHNFDHYQINPAKIKFINPRQGTPDRTSMYYLKQPSPIEKRRSDETRSAQPGKKSLKGLSVKGVQELLTRKIEETKGGRHSQSGRRQFSELSEIMTTLGFSQNSTYMHRNPSSHNKMTRTEIQSFDRKGSTKRKGDQTTIRLVPREESSSKRREGIKKLEINDVKYVSYKTPKVGSSKELLISSGNVSTSNTTTNKKALTVKIASSGMYSVKAGSTKDLKMVLKKDKL